MRGRVLLGDGVVGCDGGMMTRQLDIYLRGDLGRSLDAFRERLGLRKRGRLSDDWDDLFGSRDLRPADRGRMWLHLSRLEDPDEWSVSLAFQGEPMAVDDLERLRADILAAAAEVGVTVTRQVPLPGEKMIDGSRLLAARQRLAAWMTERSRIASRTITTDDIARYTVGERDEWLVFSPGSRASQVYLVSDDSVYKFSPAWETLDTALENARSQRG